MKLFVYFCAGFIWEVLITSYHHCLISHKNFIASFLAMIITIVSLLVISNLTKEIITATTGTWNIYAHVLIFALGKGIGAFLSLTLWSKRGIDKKEPREE